MTRGQPREVSDLPAESGLQAGVPEAEEVVGMRVGPPQQSVLVGSRSGAGTR